MLLCLVLCIGGGRYLKKGGGKMANDERLRVDLEKVGAPLFVRTAEKRLLPPGWVVGRHHFGHWDEEAYSGVLMMCCPAACRGHTRVLAVCRRFSRSGFATFRTQVGGLARLCVLYSRAK